ncbi:protein-glutamate O-methyltransferase CheR [Sphingobium sp. AN641]|uniref:CheR family methyltransferase n=1 Tax=Sphingobium sp. AN641 TaxID=3133443 RepID=UPI0030BECB5F
MVSAAPAPPSQGATRILTGLLEARTGQVLSENRAWRTETALRPVMRTHGLADIDALAAKLVSARDPRLEEDVVNALLNNESSFFRDLQVFDMLYRDVLPQLRDTKRDRVLRVWSAGCSTGQEAYSIAIQLRKTMALWRDWRIEILATDISTAAIDQARSGAFSQIDVQRGLAIGDLLKWFEPVGDDWKANDELRQMIDFRADNLFTPKAPTGLYDLILCRNVLLYFNADRRKSVFDLLAHHAHPQAVLFLGAGETVIGQSDDFQAHPTFRGAYARRFASVAGAAGALRNVG